MMNLNDRSNINGTDYFVTSSSSSSSSLLSSSTTTTTTPPEVEALVAATATATADNNSNHSNSNTNTNNNSNTNNFRIIPEILIPGPFVVLQGNIGDGISNTIDGLPYPILTNRLSSTSNRSATGRGRQRRNNQQQRSSQRQQQRSSSSSQREEEEERRRDNDSTSSYHHVPRTTAATVAAGSLFATVATTPTTSEYVVAVVVNEDGDNHYHDRRRRQQQEHDVDITTHSSSDNATATTTTRQQEELQQQTEDEQQQQQQQDRISIEIWNNTRRRIELQQRRDWIESLQQNVPNYLLENHIMMKNTNSNSNNNNNNNNNTWWEKNGKIVVLRELPTKLRGGGRRSDDDNNWNESVFGRSAGTVHIPSIIGLLCPGSTIYALDLIELNSNTLLPITDIDIDIDIEQQQQTRQQHGRIGIIQMIKLETKEGRIGYSPINLDGYPLLSPGQPNQYNMQLLSDNWIWRVTCPSGAYLRDGLDLNTNHIYTLPYGSLISVSKRCINNQGLSRIKTTAIIPGDGDDKNEVIHGWCSELLNPLSGQRGIIAQPLPYCIPAIYRVTLPIGAVIRKDIELSSPKIGIAEYGTLIKVCKRAFSEHPIQNCIERLQLVGNGGWISIRLNRLPPDDDLIVEYVNTDTTFDPDSPGIYHLNEQRRQRQVVESESDIQRRQQQQRRELVGRGRETTNNTDDLSSVDENHENYNDNGSNDEFSSTELDDDYDLDNSNNHDNNNHDNNNNHNRISYCVVCLTSECNATIVHGETGHVVCCLICARILKARGDNCPVCRLNIDLVIQHFYA